MCADLKDFRGTKIAHERVDRSSIAMIDTAGIRGNEVDNSFPAPRCSLVMRDSIGDCNGEVDLRHRAKIRDARFDRTLGLSAQSSSFKESLQCPSRWCSAKPFKMQHDRYSKSKGDASEYT